MRKKEGKRGNGTRESEKKKKGIACDIVESGRENTNTPVILPSLELVSLTSGCLIGVETSGVTGNTVAVSSAECPNACRIQGDPPSLVRYHG